MIKKLTMKFYYNSIRQSNKTCDELPILIMLLFSEFVPFWIRSFDELEFVTILENNLSNSSI